MKTKIYMFPCTLKNLMNLPSATLTSAHRGICEITSDLTSSNFVSFFSFSTFLKFYYNKPICRQANYFSQNSLLNVFLSHRPCIIVSGNNFSF